MNIWRKKQNQIRNRKFNKEKSNNKKEIIISEKNKKIE
jgi:hypothetical protein